MLNDRVRSLFHHKGAQSRQAIGIALREKKRRGMGKKT